MNHVAKLPAKTSPRSYMVGKTRQGKPKVTLYENGRAVIARPTDTTQKAHRLGRAWADSHADA